MFKRALAFALILCAQFSFAQSVLNGTPTYSTATAQTVMPAGSPIHVNNKYLIGRRPGDGSVAFHLSCDRSTGAACLGENSASPSVGSVGAPGTVGGNGAFRINCSISHQSYDDPIVWPGHPGITHLHTFVGNTSTSFASDLTDMSLSGISTCAGGRVNASGYWFPTPIYHCPSVAVGCDVTRDGQPVHFAAYANVYYKCDKGASGPNCTTAGSAPTVRCPLADHVTPDPNGCKIQWAPIGFRIIKGNAAARAAFPDGTGTLKFACFRYASTFPNNYAGIFFDHIPTQAEAAASGLAPDGTAASGGNGACDNINMLVDIQNCWDGVNLDSPLHNTHAIPEDESGGYICSNASYPVPILSPSMNQHFDVQNQADLNYLRLSSDPPCADEVGGVAGTANCNGKANNGQPAGWTLHMDWVNGWNHEANFGGFGLGTATDLILRGCINLNQSPAAGVDCHDVNFGSPLNDGKFYQIGK